MTRKTQDFNPNADWQWEGCIEYADGRFESVWSSPYEGEDEVTVRPATPDEIERHKRVEQIAEQDTVQAGLITERVLFGNISIGIES